MDRDDRWVRRVRGGMQLRVAQSGIQPDHRSKPWRGRAFEGDGQRSGKCGRMINLSVNVGPSAVSLMHCFEKTKDHSWTARNNVRKQQPPKWNRSLPLNRQFPSIWEWMKAS